MKKRAIALFAAGIMVFFAACAGGEAPAEQPAATPEAVSTPAPTAEPVEIPVGRLFVTINGESGEYFPENGTQAYFTYECETPEVSGVGADAINPVLQQRREEFMSGRSDTDVPRSVTEYEAAARQDNLWREQEGAEPVSYSLMRHVNVARGDETVISFLYDDYSYTGGAHGFTARTALNFRSDGTQLSFADLSPDPEALRQRCVEQMLVLSRSAEFARCSFYYEYPSILPELAADGSWYFSDEGLVFVANPYDIAPYAFGRIEFTVAYGQVEDLVYDWVLPVDEGADGTLWGALGSEKDSEPAALLDVGTAGAGRPVRFTADGRVLDVRLQRVCFNEHTGGFDVQELLWYATSMQSGEVLRLLTWIPDTMPDLKISYRGRDGREQAWYISQSGLDGALVLLDGADFTTLPREITEELPFRYDLDNDGAMEMVDVQSYFSDDLGATALRIAVTESDGTVYTADTIAYWDQRLWLADGDGDRRAEIYFSGNIGSDDHLLYGWRCEDGALSPMTFRDEAGQADWLLGQILSVDSAHQFHVLSARYILGVYSAVRPFVIDGDGVFAPAEGSCWEFDRNQFWLELACDLSAQVEGEQRTLPAGSHILLSATDGESWVEFYTEDYSTGRLSLSRGGDGWLVDGIRELDAFVVLPYAG